MCSEGLSFRGTVKLRSTYQVQHNSHLPAYITQDPLWQTGTGKGGCRESQNFGSQAHDSYKELLVNYLSP